MRKPDSKLTNAKVTFHNTRARFQRMEDAKLFNGWVNSLTPKGVIVSTSQPLQIQPGQIFRFEVFGTGAIAVFEARLEIVSGPLSAFVLTSPVRAMPSKEEMRLRATDILARLFLMSKPDLNSGIADLDRLSAEASTTPVAEGHVLDLSASGIGLLANTIIKKGECLRVEIDTPWGVTEGIGEVRYCKPEGSHHRIGLVLTEMDRLSKGLYDRLLKKSAAA